MAVAPLVDSFGRRHQDLRISITDRCNIRCTYCMPNELIHFLPREELLSYEEIVRFASAVSPAGICKLRITGGEPLVRNDVAELVRQLVGVPGIQDVAITTNGILLAEHAKRLRKAGLHRLNISLDTLDEARFQKLTRRPGLHRVLEGIHEARAAGFDRIRLNSIAMRGVTEPEIIPLVEFARNCQLEIRFIEFMPLDAEQNWNAQDVLTGAEIRKRVESEWGPLREAFRPSDSQPAIDYQFTDGKGGIGFINPVSEPFCGTCNRLRITAEGGLRNCLFAHQDWDVRPLLRDPQTGPEQILERVRTCLAAKKAGHGIDDASFLRPRRAMYQIGG